MKINHSLQINKLYRGFLIFLMLFMLTGCESKSSTKDNDTADNTDALAGELIEIPEKVTKKDEYAWSASIVDNYSCRDNLADELRQARSSLILDSLNSDTADETSSDDTLIDEEITEDILDGDFEEDDLIEEDYYEDDFLEADSDLERDNDEAVIECSQPLCRIAKNTGRLICDFSFIGSIPDSDDTEVYLFEIASFEDEFLIDKEPIARAYKNRETTLVTPFITRHLFARFVPAILLDGAYVPIAKGQYITNPEVIAHNNDEYLQVDSKKGLLLDANTLNTEYLSELNVKKLVYNLPLSFIMGPSPNDIYPTIEYEYNGNIYEFNGYQLAGFDLLFKYLTDRGYHNTIIILNDWNKLYPVMMHPLSRKRTSESMYYAFNTEEEEGVRLMEAAALFLAERYSGGEYGMVQDWVIANEINQQKIWNYMATDDLDYYTDSFEKSFRSFYNAIRSNYSNAHVYFSIDHDWNDNRGNNRRFFNGRDLMYCFNDLARSRGNYDWALSIHPYPAPLNKVKFWNGSFNKTEEASVVTPMNLSALTSLMTKDDFLNTKGEVRPIGITELGFSSKAGENLHAAAFAYCYYIIEDNEYINSFLLNRQTDDLDSLKSGLALGIYNNDYSSKRIKEVFTNIDSEAGEAYIPEMLQIIGADSLEEALDWAR